jgi:hypothetical protein
MRLLFFIEFVLQKLLPKSWRLAISRLRIVIYWFISWCGIPYFRYRQNRFKAREKKCRDKEILKVAFFAFQDSIWKYDSVYRQMETHNAFEPIVIVIPYINYGWENMLLEMQKTFNAFTKRGYKVVKSYDQESNLWLDVKKSINPDLIFYSSPYRLTRPEYQIGNFLDCLSAYVPYGVMTVNMEEEQYNLLFHNLVWRCYYETPIHMTIAKQYSHIKASNVKITGYPQCDIFTDKTHHSNEVWKNKDTQVKRIIWAPHHTIEANATLYSYSNFMQYHEFMFELVKKYAGLVQIAFKPHPILKLKLYKHPDWGKRKTDEYFTRWKESENCQLEEGNYEDLFITSHALILDSISFMSEYCYTGKPSMFLIRDEKVPTQFNDFGKQVFQILHKGRNQDDILEFVETIVNNCNDSLAQERADFVRKNLIPANNLHATDNIINDILQTIYRS